MRLAWFKRFLKGTTALHAWPHLHPQLTKPLPWSDIQEMSRGMGR